MVHLIEPPREAEYHRILEERGMKAKKETGAKLRRIWSSLLAVMLVASVLVLPASANSREKNHDYLDWLIFDSEILNVELAGRCDCDKKSDFLSTYYLCSTRECCPSKR